ncbi:ABC transporter ATP-binding protein [Corynebacterium sphenisci]|uniref:ABC transporter ATP-binding protein n=1 Tax=Corynebacterium sphenisci TaxID=191493 RepID=UPI0026DFF3BB|nr:ABC transporter ATP-binding protein [Corynebacterium sphenisci]MDO5731830.1 ABC transporter ATP-binding protein [Corynebacterium sphenisci]
MIAASAPRAAEDPAGLAGLPGPALAALGLLALVQLGLMAAALVALARTPSNRLRHIGRLGWFLAIVIANIIGPIAFLTLGRAPVGIPDPAAGGPAGPRRPADPGEPAAPTASRRGPVPADAPPAIEIRGLRKSYRGAVVLPGLDLAVPAGSVFGLLGRNGSGKTTTLRILMGLHHADAGLARVAGHPAGSAAALAACGYLPDVPAVDPWCDGPGALRQAGRLAGLSGPALERRIGEVLRLTRLDGAAGAVAGYSRGMRQRLGIAHALLADPEVLILDEPTSALDPIARAEVLAVLAGLRGRVTVFFSTHAMAEVAAVCDRAAFLDGGRVVDSGTLAELVARHAGDPPPMNARFRCADADAAAAALSAAGCAEVALDPGAGLQEAFAAALAPAGGAR